MRFAKRLIGVCIMASALAACATDATSRADEVTSALEGLDGTLQSCPVFDSTPVLPAHAGDVHVASDIPYSPTCDVAGAVRGTIDGLKKKYPSGVVIVLTDPKVIVSGTVPARVLEVRLNIVVIKSLPVDDGQGGLKDDVEVVIVDFDAWASSHGFEQTQIDNIRLQLERDGVAVSGDFHFKKVDTSQSASKTLVTKIVIEKGTSYPTAKKQIDAWVKEGKPDYGVKIVRP